MGQLALGFRSLLFKLAIFVVMAAMLAWALGGTLWPRAETVDLETVVCDGRDWFWRLSVGGREPGAVRWTLMTTDGDGEPVPVDERIWAEVSGPVATADGLYYAGRAATSSTWSLERRSGSEITSSAYLDRLAIERQLARVRAGLPPEDPAETARRRRQILEPAEPGD